MRDQKRIGIVGWRTGENSFGITVPYANFIKQFGEVVILTPQTGIVEGLDLVILPGGEDMNPNCYGQPPGFYTSNTNVFKQYFFDVNLKQYIRAHVPIFGICLGLQQLNVFFGGELTQHFLCKVSKDRVELVDDLVDELPYNSKKVIQKVNSMHHQAVMPDQLGKGLIPRLYSDSGNVEMFSHESLPITAVQWHPEEIHDHIAIGEVMKLLYKYK